MNMIAVLSDLDAAGFSLLRLLVTVLWQSTILLAACGGLAFLLRKRKESARHALWVGALLLLPLLPVLSWTISSIGAPRREIPVLPAYASPPEVPLVSNAPALQPAITPLPSSTLPAQSTPKASLRLYPWAAGLMAYAGVVFFLLSAVLAGRLRVRRWIREGEAVMDDRTFGIFERVCGSLGLRREVTLIESVGTPVPFAFHTFHPVVALPKGFASRLSDSELASVLAHELAHVQRHDPLTLTLVSLVRAVFFFQPLAWLASRETGYLAECACDSTALEMTGESRFYAGLISRLAEELPRRAASPEYAAGLVLSRSVFLKRVETILSERRKSMKRLTGLALAGTMLAATVSLTAALAFGPGEMNAAQGTSAVRDKTNSAPSVQVAAAVADTLAVGMVKISGKVVGYDGKPVGDANVYLYSGKRSLLQPPKVESVARTAGDGSFVFPLPSERLNGTEWFNMLIFHSRGYAIVEQRITEKPDLGRISLGKGTEITAVFKDKSGRPVKDAILTIDRIRADNGSGIMDVIAQIPEMTVRSKDQGKAVVSGLPENSIISVTASGPGYATEYRRDSILSGDDNIPIVLLHEGRIEGRVTLSDTGKPAAGFPVKAYGPENWYPSGKEVMTDINGRYSIENARPGTYRLYVNMVPDALSKYALSTVENIIVEEGRIVHDVNTQLVRGGIITGRVTREDTGDPVPEVQVVVMGIAGGYTDRDGVYRLCVPPGKADVRIFMGTPEGYTPIITPIPVEVAEGKTVEGVDFTYRKKNVIPFTVKVLSPEGTPVAGAMVREAVFGKGIATGADGKITLTDLTEGQPTFIHVDKKDAGLYGLLQTNAHSGVEAVVTLHRYELATVEGRVVDEKGISVPRVKVEYNLRSPDNETQNMSLFSMSRNTVSDNSGKFRLKDVVLGGGVALSLEAEGYEKSAVSIPELTKGSAALKDVVMKKTAE